MKKALILCSGGLDSVVCAHHIKKKLGYSDIILLFFDYGQRARDMEEACVRRCSRDIKGKFLKIKLPIGKILSGGLLKYNKIKKAEIGGLEDTSKESERWYVPQRNLIFFSYALSIAESFFIKEKTRWDVFCGFKNEGKEHYPDSTKKFIEKIDAVKSLSDSANFSVFAPLIEMDKEDIIITGEKLGVDFNNTYSCYIGRRKHCGECLACRLRKEGFKWANISDPTSYFT